MDLLTAACLDCQCRDEALAPNLLPPPPLRADLAASSLSLCTSPNHRSNGNDTRQQHRPAFRFRHRRCDKGCSARCAEGEAADGVLVGLGREAGGAEHLRRHIRQAVVGLADLEERVHIEQALRLKRNRIGRAKKPEFGVELRQIEGFAAREDDPVGVEAAHAIALHLQNHAAAGFGDEGAVDLQRARGVARCEDPVIGDVAGDGAGAAEEPVRVRDRGRDAGCPAPPAQIRTCPIRAYGSYLGYLTASRSSGQG